MTESNNARFPSAGVGSKSTDEYTHIYSMPYLALPIPSECSMTLSHSAKIDQEHALYDHIDPARPTYHTIRNFLESCFPVRRLAEFSKNLRLLGAEETLSMYTANSKARNCGFFARVVFSAVFHDANC